MPRATRRRMCVCCGDYYFIAGDVRDVEDKMCATCGRDMNDMDGPDFYAFISDVEKVLREESSVRSPGFLPQSVEELIDVMDH